MKHTTTWMSFDAHERNIKCCLPSIRIRRNMVHDTCCICLCDVEEDHYSCSTCTHHFHFDCLKEWWAQGVGCPLCRQCEFESFITSLTGKSEATTTAEYMLLFTCYITMLVTRPDVLHTVNTTMRTIPKYHGDFCSYGFRSGDQYQ
jgi:hypothetical protein